MPKPPSPTFDPRSGLSYAQQQALHIDHGPLHIDHGPPLPPEPEPFTPGLVDHGMGAPPLQGNPYLPPPNIPPPNEFDQTPSDYSYSTNHSDTGYMSGTSGSNFGRNQFPNNGPFGGNFGPVNPSGQFDFGGNRSQIPPPQSPFVKPGQFGNTPLTPMTPQTPHPQTPHPITPQPQTPRPLIQNDVQDRSFDSRDRGGRDRGGRNRDKGDWDRGNDRNRHKNNDWNRDRDNRYNRDSRDRDKGRRDWKYERDNEYSRRERERERERERNRNNDRDRRRNDFRESRNNERESSREKVVEKEIPKEEPYIEPFVPPTPIVSPTPPPPTFTPKPAEPKEEDEPRSMSLESRIQSLLSGFRSPEPAKPQPKEETPPPTTSKTAPLPPSENAQSGFEKSDSGSDLVSLNKNGGTPLYNQTMNEHSTPGHDSNHGWPNNFPNGPMPVNTQISQDDEDRMSLDSNDSGGGNTSIEINPAAIKPDIPGMPPPLMSIPVKPPWPSSSASSFDLGGFPPSQNANINSFEGTFDYMSGPYNQNYMNQFNNELNNAEIEMSDEISEFQREKEQRTERTFGSVLEDFVDELKEILMKDLCKKMVENSGFREYDSWWNKEEDKRKVKSDLSHVVRKPVFGVSDQVSHKRGCSLV